MYIYIYTYILPFFLLEVKQIREKCNERLDTVRQRNKLYFPMSLIFTFVHLFYWQNFLFCVVGINNLFFQSTCLKNYSIDETEKGNHYCSSSNWTDYCVTMNKSLDGYDVKFEWESDGLAEYNGFQLEYFISSKWVKETWLKSSIISNISVNFRNIFITIEKVVLFSWR